MFVFDPSSSIYIWDARYMSRVDKVSYKSFNQIKLNKTCKKKVKK